MTAGVPWIRLDAPFPEHPRSVDAGWEGQLVFIHLMLLSKQFGLAGRITGAYARPKYLQRRMGGLPLDVLTDGLHAAHEAGLLQQVDDGWVIPKWTAYQSDPGAAERKRLQRVREKEAKSAESPTAVTDVTVTSQSHECHDDGTGRDGTNGTGQDKKEISSTSHPKVDQSKAQIREVFDHYKATLNHPTIRLTADRRGKIRARLRDGRSVDDLKRAIDGCAASAYHMGDNDDGKVYDSTDLIFRNDGKVEQFIGYLSGPKIGSPQPWLAHGMTEDAYRRNGPPMEKR